MLLTLCGANGSLLLALTSQTRELPRFTSSPSSTHNQFTVGQAAPPLALPDLDGWPWTLSDQQGQVVLIAFWTTWCTPCLTELDHIQTLYDAHLPGLVIITVCQEARDADSVRAFVRERGWSFPVLHDAELITVHRYQVRAVPRTLLVDQEGMVRYDHLGYGSGHDAELDAAIGALLPTTQLGED
jgi:peroxiredoxin